MKQEILDRLKELGGNIDQVKGNSIVEDLLSISFNTVLYRRPIDTPWATADETEPIYGIGKFVDDNKDLFDSDKDTFYNKMIDTYYRLTKEGYGQMFWIARLFTPYKEGTSDFEEWNMDFTDDVNLEEVYKIVDDPKPDFIQLFYSYGFPDNYYICLSDPNPENPTLFGTDHEQFFYEVTNEGNLEEFLRKFMTKKELIEIVKKRIDK